MCTIISDLPPAQSCCNSTRSRFSGVFSARKVRRLCGPRTLLPDSFESPGVHIERDLDAVLPHVDAIMMLRIQRERIVSGLLPSLDDYTRRFQLNPTRLARLSHEAVILHPGPYNRGVELTDEVLDDRRSRYVVQVHNGVFVRMAVLEFLINGARVSA